VGGPGQGFFKGQFFSFCKLKIAQEREDFPKNPQPGGPFVWGVSPRAPVIFCYPEKKKTRGFFFRLARFRGKKTKFFWGKPPNRGGTTSRGGLGENR